MKNIMRSGLMLVLLTLVFSFTSCKKHTAALLDKVGDDAVLVITIKPLEWLKSAGATIDDGKLKLSRSLKEIMGKDGRKGFKDLMSVKGYDYEQAVFFTDSHNLNGVLICITDEGDFTSSLREASFTPQTVKGHKVFVNEDESAAVLIEDNVAVVFNLRRTDVDEYVENYLDFISTPLKDWKRDQLLKSNDMNILATPNDLAKYDVSVAAAFNFDGPKMSMVLTAVTSKGTAEKFTAIASEQFEDYEVGDISEQIKYVSDKDLLSFAWVGLKDVSLYHVLSKIDLPREYSLNDAQIDNPVMRALNGAMFASVNPANKNAFGSRSLDDWQIVAGVGTVDGKADKMLSFLKENSFGMMTRSGDGYKVEIPGSGTVNLEKDGEFIVARTKKESDNSKVSASDAKNCLLWASVNIPANFEPLRPAGVKCGIKGKLKGYADHVDAIVEFTDTDLNFLDQFFTIVNSNNHGYQYQ